MKRIVYQGIEGSFSHLTVRRLFGFSCQYEYLFYIDLENEPKLPIEEMRRKTKTFMILGSYDVIS